MAFSLSRPQADRAEFWRGQKMDCWLMACPAQPVCGPVCAARAMAVYGHRPLPVDDPHGGFIGAGLIRPSW